ncbi:MAG: acetyl-CoA C-acetyltransferase, partial [Proteobacteria bacterium]
SARIPFAKSMTAYRGVNAVQMMSAPLAELRAKFGLTDGPLGDVALGAVMNSSADWNISREAVLEAGLDPYTPAYNVQRACGTGLETVGQLASKIALSQIEDGIGGGYDTNSVAPIEVSDRLRDTLLNANSARTMGDRLKIFSRLRPADLLPKTPAVVEKRTRMSMGQHCEIMAKEWQISRESQDELALASHLNAAKAYDSGFYTDLVMQFKGANKDLLVRADTTLEKLSKLKPAFDKKGGTLTAGNSSPLTDGSSAVLLASSERAKQRDWAPLARFVDVESSAIDFVKGDGLLMAPTVAVGRLLQRNNLKLQDFDYYEIHEAFAAQVLCTLKAWESDAYCRKFLKMDALGSIDRAKMNIVGGSTALGHPFGATGGRIVGTLAKLLSNHKGQGRGLISICTAGGMGVAAILETV